MSDLKANYCWYFICGGGCMICGGRLTLRRSMSLFFVSRVLIVITP